MAKALAMEQVLVKAALAKDSMRIVRVPVMLTAMVSVISPEIQLALADLATVLAPAHLLMLMAMVFVMSAAAPILKTVPACVMAAELANKLPLLKIRPDDSKLSSGLILFIQFYFTKIFS